MYFQTRPLAGPEIAESRLTNLYQLKPDHYSFILASTATTDNHHFDILLAHPQQSLELYHRDIAANKPGFLDALQAWWLREKIDPVALASDESAIELPFTGGWFIYLAYELVAEIEPVLELPAPDQDEPVALAVRCPCAVIFDHQRKRHIAVAEQAYSDLLDTIERDFHAAVESSEPAADLMASVRALDVREADEAPYLAQVARIKQYIVDGDIFQANLSRPW